MLVCTSCGEEYSDNSIRMRCDCGEPLELDLQSGDLKEGDNVWRRFEDFYPFSIDFDRSLGEGETPLTSLDRFSSDLGFSLFVKNESVNPTWSFKDRGTFIGVQRAVDLGFDEIGTVSTGNMAASVAAYSAYNDLRSNILVSAEISSEKIKPISVYGPNLIKVSGDYGELYYRSLEIGKDKNIYFINSDNPFRVEGYKSISYEIFEQTKPDLPDYISVPTSSGGLFRGVLKGFRELKKSGLITKIPNMVCGQSKGCSPIYQAFKEDVDEIKRFENPETLAHAIANPHPPSGNEVLRKLKQFNGYCESINDKEIQDIQRKLSKEGIFVQPASVVGIGAIKKLKQRNIISKNDKIVSIVTGSGLKTIQHQEIENKPEKININNLRNKL